VNFSNLAISLNRLSDQSLDHAAAMAHELGVRATTFFGMSRPHTSGEPALGFLWDELDADTQEATRALRKRFDRAVIHAPFVDVPLLSLNPHIEREAQRQIFMAVNAAAALDLEVVTVHAPLPGRLPPEEFHTRLVDVLRQLGDAAAEAGTTIGLENWRYPADPDEHGTLLEAVDHPAVGATLDVGHIAYWFQRDGVTRLADEYAIMEYHRRLHALIDRIGPRIVHVHLHDVRAADLQDHRGVGRGVLDFAAIFNRLDELSFDGLILLELGEPDYPAAVRESVERLRPLCCTPF